MAIRIGYTRRRESVTTWTRLSTLRHPRSAVRIADASVPRPTARTRASGSLIDRWPARNAAAIFATFLSIGWTTSTTESIKASVRLIASGPRRLAPTSTSANALAGRTISRPRARAERKERTQAAWCASFGSRIPRTTLASTTTGPTRLAASRAASQPQGPESIRRTRRADRQHVREEFDRPLWRSRAIRRLARHAPRSAQQQEESPDSS